VQPIPESFVILIVEIDRELRSKPNAFRPIAIFKQMIHIFNLRVTSRAERATVNASSYEIFPNREGVMENTPHEMFLLWRDLKIPQLFPDMIVIIGVAGSRVIVSAVPL
jgi:hypothetical protein